MEKRPVQGKICCLKTALPNTEESSSSSRSISILSLLSHMEKHQLCEASGVRGVFHPAALRSLAVDTRHKLFFKCPHNTLLSGERLDALRMGARQGCWLSHESQRDRVRKRNRGRTIGKGDVKISSNRQHECECRKV